MNERGIKRGTALEKERSKKKKGRRRRSKAEEKGRARGIEKMGKGRGGQGTEEISSLDPRVRTNRFRRESARHSSLAIRESFYKKLTVHWYALLWEIYERRRGRRPKLRKSPNKRSASLSLSASTLSTIER